MERNEFMKIVDDCDTKTSCDGCELYETLEGIRACSVMKVLQRIVEGL